MTDEERVKRRKVQITGGSTYIVSLPKKWVKEMDIEVGDDIAIEKRGSSLHLTPADLKEETHSESIMEIEPEDNKESTTRKILSLYLSGSKTIKLKASKRIQAEQRTAIKELVDKKLIGTEIIFESIEEITLQTLLTYSELSVKDALKRMYKITSSMNENAMVALEKFDQELARNVIELDNEVDRFRMYLTRAIKATIDNPSLTEEVGLDDQKQGLSYKSASKEIERAADHAGHIAEHVLLLEEPVDKELMTLYKEMNQLSKSIFEEASESIFREDYEAAEKIIKKREELYSLENKINQSISAKNLQDAIRERMLNENIRRIAEHSFNIAEIVLNMTFDKKPIDLD